MNINFVTASPHHVEVEMHFTDGKIYNFEVSCQPHIINMHTAIGRRNAEIAKMLVKIDEYWYTEQVPANCDHITIKIDGREKYTQMLRDAAMKVKP